MSISTEIAWIAVDWGTSALRVWALDAAANVIAARSSNDGMGALSTGAFEPALLRLIDAWLPVNARQPLPVLACGMVGARQGWCEAAYRKVPCSPIGAPFTTPKLKDRRIDFRIIPGLSQHTPPDVMRGEETQIAGLLHEKAGFDGVACLPGTHTKWACIAEDRIESFRTFMTGELFDLISTHSILRHSVTDQGWSSEAFGQGVKDALAQPASLAADLFTLRAGSLLDGLEPRIARARLSGLLIGAELAATRTLWAGRKVAIVGNGGMANAYATALGAQGAMPEIRDATTVTLAGLRSAYRIYKGNPR